MNLNNQPNIDQFRDLLRQHDDHAGHHVLWVRRDGEVLLTCLPKEKPSRVPTYEHPDMQLRYDTFPIGYDYVGPEAAADTWWTSELFRNLLQQWTRARGTSGLLHIPLHTVAPDGCPVDAEEAARLQRYREEAAGQQQQTSQHGCHAHMNP
jgi:hypothetical protein